VIHVLTRLTGGHFPVAQSPRFDSGAATTTIGFIVDVQPLPGIPSTMWFVEQLAVDGNDAFVLLYVTPILSKSVGSFKNASACSLTKSLFGVSG
jgi:hypothetical protein